MAIIVPAIDEEAKALPVTIGFHIKVNHFLIKRINKVGWQ